MPATLGSGVHSGITWAPWTVYYLTIILLVLIPVPTFLPVYTHSVSKTMHVFFLCIPPVGESAAGHLGWNLSPCGDSEVYFTVRCGSVHLYPWVTALTSLCFKQHVSKYIEVHEHSCYVASMAEVQHWCVCSSLCLNQPSASWVQSKGVRFREGSYVQGEQS